LKIADFIILAYPTCIWWRRWGWPYWICRDLWCQKSRVPGVLCGVVWV